MRSGSRSRRSAAGAWRAEPGRPEQRTELVGRDVAPRAGCEIAQLDRAEAHSHELVDRQPQRGAQPPHDVLAALAQADLEPRLRREPAERPEAARHHDAFLETDAAAHAPEHAAVGRAVHLHLVDALDAASRVHQALGQGAVVGEEKQAAALQVQATDRIQALVHVREQITHRGTALGVGQRAHHATRLVDHDGTAARAWRELLAVDGDSVADASGPAPGRRRW